MNVAMLGLAESLAQTERSAVEALAIAAFMVPVVIVAVPVITLAKWATAIVVERSSEAALVIPLLLPCCPLWRGHSNKARVDTRGYGEHGYSTSSYRSYL